MLQVRFHGRGGQGVVTAAEMLSIAAFEHGVQGLKPGGQFQVGRQGSEVIELLLDPLARLDGLAIGVHLLDQPFRYLNPHFVD